MQVVQVQIQADRHPVTVLEVRKSYLRVVVSAPQSEILQKADRGGQLCCSGISIMKNDTANALSSLVSVCSFVSTLDPCLCWRKASNPSID